MNREEAIKICKELWTYLAEAGLEKKDWDGWDKYGEMWDDCPLCEFSLQGDCGYCPYDKVFGWCCGVERPYSLWCITKTKTERKKYAKEFLAQLEQL